MAAEIELTGVIEFEANTDKVAPAVQKSTEQANKTLPAAGQKAGASFGAEFQKSFTKNLQGITTGFLSRFGVVGRSLAQAMNSGGAGGSAAGAASSSGGVSVPPVIGAGGGAAAGLSGAGVAGIVAGGALLAVGAFVKLVQTVKGLITEFIAFGRSLAQWSGRMAMSFAEFDVEIMRIKHQMGEALAPTMRALLNEIVSFIRSNQQLITTLLSGLGKTLQLGAQVAGGATKVADWATAPTAKGFGANWLMMTNPATGPMGAILMAVRVIRKLGEVEEKRARQEQDKMDRERGAGMAMSLMNFDRHLNSSDSEAYKQRELDHVSVSNFRSNTERGPTPMGGQPMFSRAGTGPRQQYQGALVDPSKYDPRP